MDVTFYEPLGVVGIIVPWNFPMPIAGWGFAPALAAGNTVVLKPAELTPLTALRLAELALEAGLPPGVFTVLPGRGSVVGARFVTHPVVRKVCFTGSTAVGKEMMAGAAEQVKRGDPGAGRQECQHHLRRQRPRRGRGGRTRRGVRQRRSGLLRPLPDPGAAQRHTTGSWSCWSRRCAAYRGGDPADAATEMGPLISARQHEMRVEPTSRARPWPSRGTAPEPAPASGTRRQCSLPTRATDRVWREEVFGPVVAVVPFDDEADAIAMANDTDYGLSGIDLDRDVGRALRVARAVEAGNLSVN